MSTEQPIQAAQAPVPENRDFVSLQEIVATARQRLPQDLWDHLSGGADSEMTLRRNRLALDSLALRQRVMVNVADLDIRTTLLGQTLATPVFLAPVGGFLGMAHPDGGIPVARAAVAHGTTAFISTAAKPSIEAVQQAVDRAAHLSALRARRPRLDTRDPRRGRRTPAIARCA